MLTARQLGQFVDKGYLRLDRAFSRELANQGRALLWRDTGCDPEEPATWRRPVIRLGMYAQAPFVQAANAPALHEAFDQLAGVGAWRPCGSVGSFPVRFPSAESPGDDGWHVDMSFGGDPSDFLSWRINIHSRGRVLLMLMLFSDVGENDAPTRIRAGSHRAIARRLAHAGEDGLSLHELAAEGFRESAECPQALATGEAGTVYLCHPFLVHAAQPHRGARPRFMAQPPLLPAGPLDENTPVMRAISDALRAC